MTHETEVHMRVAIDTLRDAAFAVQAACERLSGPRMLSADEWEMKVTMCAPTDHVEDEGLRPPDTRPGWMLVREHAMIGPETSSWQSHMIVVAIWARKKEPANG